MPRQNLLLRDAAVADGRSERLEVGVSVRIEEGHIVWIRPTDSEEEVDADAEIIDAGGATIVPGMVDAHSHLTLPGGSHWIDRIQDPTEDLLAVAEHNGELLTRSGVRWARDVGAPRRVDPHDGRERALSLGVRDRWRDRADRPHVRAAGTWVGRAGTLPADVAIEVGDGAGLRAAVAAQLDDDADLIKLYLDGPDPEEAPFAVDDIAAAVAVAHDGGAKVTAHATVLPGARAGADAGVDALEHGSHLDDDVVATMAAKGIALVSTLSVYASWRTFGATTRIERFHGEDAQAALRTRFETAMASVVMAHDAGVAVATGSDFGGGSVRAGHLAWEVGLLVEAGLQPWEALAAATWRGGDLLGEPDAGRIREGGPADLVLVHGDPLSDPGALWRVWRTTW